jgi:signal transduction histidine kinase
LQVFTNLLNNAAKFTPEGGDIAIALSRNAGHAMISVSDTGPGIPPKLIDDVFNLFVQGEQDPMHPHGGLGLGLSLVRQIVALHGGEVSVYSAGQPGKGSEFVIRLPLVAAPVPGSEHPPALS